ncbi:MAG: DUF423 domain-containing protein [Acidobacteriota bacterium]
MSDTLPSPARLFVMAGAACGFLGVAAGAFGAHYLREKIEPRLLEAFQTGVQYQLVHAVALLAVAWLTTVAPGRASHAAGWLFLVGIVLFSGSLQALALSGVRVLGAITPLGGLCFLAGWIALLLAAMRA